MAEKFLHHPHVGAAVEQVGGVRVAQGVRGDRLRTVHRQPGRRAARRSTVHAPCRVSGPPRALTKTAGVPRPAATSAGRAAHQVGPQRPHGVPADRHQPGPPALAAQQGGALDDVHVVHGGAVDVHVVHGRTDRLGDPRAGAVQELQQRLVAQSDGRPVAGGGDRAGGLQQPHHVVDRQAPGAAGGPRRAGGRPGCGSAPASPSRTAKRCSPRTAEAARGGRGHRQRGVVPVAGPQPGEVRLDLPGPDGGRGRPPRRRPGWRR